MSDKRGAENGHPVWQRLDGLTDSDLATLVESAIFVLNQKGAEGEPSPAEMPASVVESSLRAELDGNTTAAARIAQEEALSRPVAILMLQEIGRRPELAAEIERVWHERRQMMAIGAGLILSAALLLLVLKLKRVQVSRDKGVDVEFSELSKDVVGSVFRFLGL